MKTLAGGWLNNDVKKTPRKNWPIPFVLTIKFLFILLMMFLTINYELFFSLVFRCYGNEWIKKLASELALVNYGVSSFLVSVNVGGKVEKVLKQWSDKQHG